MAGGRGNIHSHVPTKQIHKHAHTYRYEIRQIDVLPLSSWINSGGAVLTLFIGGNMCNQDGAIDF